MSKIVKNVEIEKELNDVAVFVCQLVTEIFEKKPIAEITATTLLNLKDAVDGISEVPSELADDLAAVQKSFMLPIADMIASIVKKTVVEPSQSQLTEK